MTQRQISHQVTLPTCINGHTARHMHDQRAASAGGGHLLECECRQTAKHVCVGDALQQWRRINITRRPRVRRIEPVAQVPQYDMAGVVQFPLSLVRGG